MTRRRYFLSPFVPSFTGDFLTGIYYCHLNSFFNFNLLSTYFFCNYLFTRDYIFIILPILNNLLLKLIDIYIKRMQPRNVSQSASLVFLFLSFHFNFLFLLNINRLFIKCMCSCIYINLYLSSLSILPLKKSIQFIIHESEFFSSHYQ